MKEKFYSNLKIAGIVPVIALDDAKQSVPLAKALLAGGIRFAEITFRTAAAKNAIKEIANNVPDIIVGAGTVITKKQIDQAFDAGAQFLVSPGYDPELVEYADKKGLPILPGIVTPSELMQGLKAGLTSFKFFPAALYGGAKTLKAFSGPFAQASFVPTGGVKEENLSDYLSLSNVLAVGGSWMCPQSLINEKNYAEIEILSQKAINTFKKHRNMD